MPANVKRYRTRPNDVEAVHFSGLLSHEEAREIAAWCGGEFHYDAHPGQEEKRYYWSIALPNLMRVPFGGYVVKTADGAFIYEAQYPFERQFGEVTE